MNKILTLTLIAASMGCSFLANAAGPQIAELPDGYYRVGNNFTNRYIQVVDNRGSLNYAAATADMSAITLRLGLENVVSDPASVLYVEKHGDKYDIKGQNTGIYQIIGTYVNIVYNPQDASNYWAYGSKDGFTLYLYDHFGNGPTEVSYLDTTNKTYPNSRNWDITPIDNSTDNYFGVQPEMEANGKYYTTMYASFPFSCASSGMKVYYVPLIDESQGQIVYKEIIGTVPALTPVIIECSSNNPADNKLNIGGTASPITDNMLKGVLFDLRVRKHENYTTYDPSTMRSLGTTASGEVGGVVGDYTDVPRNKVYIPVTASAPVEFEMVSENDYTGISDITADTKSGYDVYTILGVKVKSNASTYTDLPTGLYIINGKKVYVP